MSIPKHLLYTILALASGLLLWLAWPPQHMAWISFFAFVPLLLLVQKIEEQSPGRSRLMLFLYSYLAFITWNFLSTFWIRHASLFGGIAAVFIVNGLLMPLPLLLFQYLRKKIPTLLEPLALIACWVSFEWFHHHWDLSWPWLSLGNAFANNTDWIQWYEYSGMFGGSVWILLLNYLLYRSLQSLSTHSPRQSLRFIAATSLLVLLPYLFSQYRLHTYSATRQEAVQMLLVQPNIDPYGEKFSEDPATLLSRMLQQARQSLDSNTDYLVFPETALTEDIFEEKLGRSHSIEKLRELAALYPRLHIITGAATYKSYPDASQKTATSRYSKRGKMWYDAFNTAIQLSSQDTVQIYHKSRLVAGVEKMPFPAIFGFLESFAINLGGTSGSLGAQPEASVFSGPCALAPVICYESVYSDYVSSYVKKGASLICIITNDGWWSNTDGYKQHCSYASLRAIENRRPIARCANTGTSCFIDELGHISQPTAWWQPTVIKATLYPQHTLSFYSRTGDWPAWICLTALLLLLPWAWFRKPEKLL